MNNLKSIWHKQWHRILAVFIFTVVSANQITHIFFEGADFGELLWFCDVMSYVLALGLWMRSRFLVSTVLLTAIPAQFLWIVDFFLQLAGVGFGRTAWLFVEADVWWTPWLSVLMHGILIPTAAYATYRLGFDRKSYWGIVLVILLLLPTTYFFTDPTINRNCVFFPCDLNFPEHGPIIQMHPWYMTPWYLLQVMFEWLFYGSVVYLLFVGLQEIRLWIQKTKRQH